MKAFLVDQTSKNTGCEAGPVTAQAKKKKLLKEVCTLHQNEHPFRAASKYINRTTSLTIFTGPLGKPCKNDYQNFSQVKLNAI